jgi:hypothetical protein
MMDKDLEEKWVKALRSGDYKQGVGRLKQAKDINTPHYTHCCLGVLAEVMIETGKWKDYFDKMTWNYWADDIIELSIHHEGEVYNLEKRLPDYLLYQEHQSQLVEMNDGEGESGKQSSFTEIADWIEENL